MLIIPGFIISGGLPDVPNSFELYNPTSGNSCPAPQDLLNMRYDHSSCSNLICGGAISPQTCEKITGTEVTPLPSLRLRQERYHHLCWSLPGPGDNKILLLGGRSSPTTSEIVSGSSSSESFELPYKTM